MAIDSERKRKSAAWVGQVFSPPTVVPDGTFATEDRQTIGWGYYGITVTGDTLLVTEIRARLGGDLRLKQGTSVRLTRR